VSKDEGLGVMNGITDIYLRAFKNMAERISSIKSSYNIRYDQVIDQDLQNLDRITNMMIPTWEEGNHTDNLCNETLLDIIKSFKKDLEESETNFNKRLGELNIEFTSLKKEIKEVDLAIKKVELAINESQ
jgi:uncharacterized Fe-S radical SAM superfamily protein PflX